VVLLDRLRRRPVCESLCSSAAGLSLLLVAVPLATDFRLGSVGALVHAGTALVAVMLHMAAQRTAGELERHQRDPLGTEVELWTARCLGAGSAVAAVLALCGVSPSALGTYGALAAATLFLLVNRLRTRVRLALAGATLSEAIFQSPAATILRSFAVAILFGALLLSLPIASATINPVGPIDALFTAASATCVTGLIVKDTPVDFSLFGQITILLLIQVGGLGIMTLAGIFNVARRQRVSLHDRMTLHGTVSIDEANMSTTLGAIARYTFTLELIGGLALFLRWWLGGEMGPLRAAWVAGFHAISAFCNAGFSLFSNSLESYSADPAVNLTVCALIIVGGLGFPVIADLRRYRRDLMGGRRPRLALHTKLVLVTTTALLLLGLVGFLLLEWHEGLLRGGLEGAYIAGFQSVTTRTAGFNTVPIGRLADATKFLFVLLMFAGASPGSTGGGIKTATLAVVAVTGWAMMLGQSRVSIFGRGIPESARHRAVAVVMLFGLMVLVWTFLLSMTERMRFMSILFEVTSAFATVGLSTGITARLSAFGRLAITAAMYLGRVGPLTVAVAVANRQTRVELEYPDEQVMVG